MSAPTVVKHYTDAGVPELSGIEGSLCVLLDYLLTLCDWETVWNGVGKRVYRPKTGLRHFLRVDDSTARGSSATRIAMMQSYESMSDVDTGLGLLGTTYVRKSGTADTVARPWSFIGDGRFFHLFIHYGSTSASIGPESECGWYCWGEGIAAPGETDFTVLMGGRDAYASATADISYAGFLQNPAAITGTGSSYCQVSKNNAGTTSAYYFGLIGNGGPCRQEAVIGGVGPVYPFKGRLMYARPYIPDDVVYDIRGYIPGLYNPIVQGAAGSGLSNRQIVIQDDKSLLIFRIRISSNCSANTLYLGWVAIDIGEGFRA